MIRYLTIAANIPTDKRFDFFRKKFCLYKHIFFTLIINSTILSNIMLDVQNAIKKKTENNIVRKGERYIK